MKLSATESMRGCLSLKFFNMYNIEQLHHAESPYDYSLFEKLSMTTAEFGLATFSVATLSTSIATKALIYPPPGKRAWGSKPRSSIPDTGDAIERIAASTICGTELHLPCDFRHRFGTDRLVVSLGMRGKLHVWLSERRKH